MTPDCKASRVRRFVARSPRSSYFRLAMLRALSFMLVAFALIFSPLAMTHGAAEAAPHDTATVVSIDSHCAGKDAPFGNNKSDAAVSCAMTCAAFPAVEPVVSSSVEPIKSRAIAGGHQPLAGIRLAGETPPPRLTPGI